MVTIKTTLCAENTCGLLIENTTGYRDAISNPTGFLTTETPATFKDYRLNDVYLFTYMVKNNWNGTFSNMALPGNTGKIVVYDSQKTYATLMEEGEITQHYTFAEDGYFSVYQLAIPKESIKDSIESTSTYVYYVKPDLTVWLQHGASHTQVNLYDVIVSCHTDWIHNNIVMLRSNLVSKCFLEWCLSAILEIFAQLYSDPNCVKDSNALKGIREKRDLLYAITNTIQYYVDLNQYYKAAKLINDVSFCNVCAEFINSSAPSNCGCR